MGRGNENMTALPVLSLADGRFLIAVCFCGSNPGGDGNLTLTLLDSTEKPSL
jgi:hypothetical protein